ncbi:hypothetical protein [Bifidobacterium fermentum]|uniref:WxL domain-containing protein n=1 Tax=Bifidobacterium fermentum TaxID=3059035 RepID=A0AB39UFQ3_9BIFI
MEEITRIYGRLIIGAAIAAALMSLLLAVPVGGSANTVSWIGVRASTVLTSANGAAGGADTTAFDSHEKRALPVVSLTGKAKAATPFRLTDLLAITDADGWTWDGSVTDGARTADNLRTAGRWTTEQTRGMWSSGGQTRSGIVQVLSLTGPAGTRYDPSAGTATIPVTGTATARIRIMDHDNVSATYSIVIPADLKGDSS